MRGLLALVAACASGPDGGPNGTDGVVTGDLARADVVGVRTTESAGNYTFYVTIRSDETGCDQYADWWEVVNPTGALVYRRILEHSHPDDQPFERSGGPIPVAADEEVVVRAHLTATSGVDGYVGHIYRGSVASGFAEERAVAGFAAELETTPPLPPGCSF